MKPSILLAALLVSGLNSFAVAAQHDFLKMNVCATVPGDTIARAFGGTLSATQPFADKSFSRCRYTVALGSGQLSFSVWLQQASDFEDLKQYIDDPMTPVGGIADGAYIFHDSGDGRFKINVVKRDDMMFQATAHSDAEARKLGGVVARILWPSKK